MNLVSVSMFYNATHESPVLQGGDEAITHRRSRFFLLEPPLMPRPLGRGGVHYVYILRSKKNGNWYTGFTADLRKRFNQHNNNESVYTKGRGPFELMYYEAYRNKEDARSREKQLKSGMGKEYIKRRLKRFLTLTG